MNQSNGNLNGPALGTIKRVEWSLEIMIRDRRDGGGIHLREINLPQRSLTWFELNQRIKDTQDEELAATLRGLEPTLMNEIYRGHIRVPSLDSLRNGNLRVFVTVIERFVIPQLRSLKN